MLGIPGETKRCFQDYVHAEADASSYGICRFFALIQEQLWVSAYCGGKSLMMEDNYHRYRMK